MWECGAPSYPRRHTARQSGASFFRLPLSATSSSHRHSVLAISLLSPDPGNAPQAMPPPQAGLETAASEQRPTSPAGFVLSLSFQEQAPQANVSAQKTPNICPSQRPLLPGGAPGQLLGVEKARDKGTERRRAGVCAGRGRSWDERARTCTPRGARGAGTRRAPSDRSSRGHPRTRPSRRQRSSPPRPPAQLRQRSGDTQLPGPPPARPARPRAPLPGTPAAPPPHPPSRRSPQLQQAAAALSRFPGSGAAAVGAQTSPRAPLSAPDPERAKKQTETHRPFSAAGLGARYRGGGGGDSIARWSRRASPAQPDARPGPAAAAPPAESHGAGADSAAAEPAAPAPGPALRATPPPAWPPSAFAVGHRRQALGTERELFVTETPAPKRVGGRGWAQLPAAPPSPAAPPPPPRPQPGGPGTSVFQSRIAHLPRGEGLPALSCALPRLCTWCPP